MTGMFDDIKVLEVANWVAAPSACAILADLGANVLKIEHPDTGDPVRSITLDHTGVNVIFELLNRGKKKSRCGPEQPARAGDCSEIGDAGRWIATGSDTKMYRRPTLESYTSR